MALTALASPSAVKKPVGFDLKPMVLPHPAGGEDRGGYRR